MLNNLKKKKDYGNNSLICYGNDVSKKKDIFPL